jgi:predicted porin
MIRKLLVVVLVLTGTGPTFAQQQPAEPTPPAPAAEAPKPPEAPKPAVTIYGTLNVNFQWAEANGATVPANDVKSRTLVSVDSSNIGFKGTTDVAGGLQVTYQCETGAQVNGSAFAGVSLCNRNSRIGLGSVQVGTLFYGNWDTPYKSGIFGTKADDPFYATDVWDFESILTSPGFNTKTSGWVAASNSTITSFAVRNNNTVAFHSASFSGFSLKAAYGANAFKNASGTQDPTLYSVGANYDYGPFSILAGFEQHKDGFGLVAINPATALAFGATVANTAGTPTAALHTTDNAWHVGAGYEQKWGESAGATTLGALLEQLSYEQKDAIAGQVKKFDRIAWQVTLKHRVGPHELRGRYSMAEKGNCTVVGGPCSTDGYGASSFAVGYAYFLAKTAQVYLHYTRIQNDKHAQYSFGTAGPFGAAGQPTVPAGADPQALGLGMRYSF